MAERRKLIEGITTPASPVDPNKEKEFVFGEKLEKDQDKKQKPDHDDEKEGNDMGKKEHRTGSCG